MPTPARVLLVGLLMLSVVPSCKEDTASPEYWTKALDERKTREQAIKDIRKDKRPEMIDGSFIQYRTRHGGAAQSAASQV